MLGRSYEGENCSAARALEVAGERWSLLILRDAIFRGVTRFSDFQRSLNIATNVLAVRLDRFVSEGVMELRPSAEHPEKFDYQLTQKGHDFQDVVLALTAWGDKWDAPHGAPILYHHRSCGGSVAIEMQCSECGLDVTGDAVVADPGPGSRTTRLAGR